MLKIRRLTQEKYAVLLQVVLNSKRQFKRLIPSQEALVIMQMYFPGYKEELKLKALQYKVIYSEKKAPPEEACFCLIL